MFILLYVELPNPISENKPSATCINRTPHDLKFHVANQTKFLISLKSHSSPTLGPSSN